MMVSNANHFYMDLIEMVWSDGLYTSGLNSLNLLMDLWYYISSQVGTFYWSNIVNCLPTSYINLSQAELLQDINVQFKIGNL